MLIIATQYYNYCCHFLFKITDVGVGHGSEGRTGYQVVDVSVIVIGLKGVQKGIHGRLLRRQGNVGIHVELMQQLYSKIVP